MCSYIIDLFLFKESATTEGTKCFKDESVGDRVGNLYYCEDEVKTDCCTENGQFDCCEPTATKAL